MRIFSRPRPSGSAAEHETITAIQNWLTARGLPCRLQPFTLYPYFFICIGLWMVITNTLLVLSIWLRWGELTGIFAILSIAGGLADTAFDIPLITWPGKTTGQNILVEFESLNPKRELVISAHYDSKTELFDHQIRTFFVRNLRLGIFLAILVGVLSNWGEIGHWVSIVLTVPLLLFAWGLGLNLSLGRLRRNPSQGAVDNGAACAILLGLAQKVTDGDVSLENIKLTLALFGGEEVNMQGSRAYALGREWNLPAAALNLEIMAQDGDYVYWEQDGMALKLFPTDEKMNQVVCKSVANVTGKTAIPVGPINSDGYSFIRAKIPLAVLGTYDSQIEARGLHLPTDNLSRVKMPRLAEGVEILIDFIKFQDKIRD
jgi:hypothetical protein